MAYPAKISDASIDRYHRAFRSDAKNLLARNAVTRGNVAEIAIDRNRSIQAVHTFSHLVKPLVPITNQKASGRCWLFAALNAMRLPLMRKYHLEKFEFSQTYLFFWDKLEKANYFLENIIQLREEELGCRLMSWLLARPHEDGGQWDMLVNLVEKYGLVPQEAMPESYHSGSSAKLNWLLNYKLREYAKELRESPATSSSQLRKIKLGMLEDVYRLLAIHLGEPPKRFDWRFHPKKGSFREFHDLTPQAFYSKHVPYKIEDKVCLIHAPTADKSYYKSYTVQYLGNVLEGHPVRYVNVPIDQLGNATLKSLKSGEAVWFGCDVAKDFHRDLGYLDTELYDYQLLLDLDLGLSKGDRLAYGESCMSHAMLFTGVDILKGKANRWRVENSWGDKAGEKGFFTMTNCWFNEHVYEVVVDKKFLSKKVQNILGRKPIVLPPWDPMGSLAL